jgi:Pyridoxamine 5'-phosphate oxidase
MADFSALEAEEPEFAARVRTAFDAYRHKVLATLRADGAPRVSGIEAVIAGGRLWLAGMSRSVKFSDLRRDPRMALHAGSDDPDRFAADTKLSGRALELVDDADRDAFTTATGMPHGADDELFRVDLDQVVLTALSDDRQALVITSWRPGRGLSEARRT